MSIQPVTAATAHARILEALPMPLLLIGPKNEVLYASPAAELFFGSSANVLILQTLDDIVPPGSPLIAAGDQARIRGVSVRERDLDLSMPRHGERIVDVTAVPVNEPQGTVLLALHERSFAQRLDRQFLHRGALRSLNGMAAVLAHEIKNPLAGIRGAAQLLEDAVPESDRTLTSLICAESDRISGLIDRMEVFGHAGTPKSEPVNIHEVLDRVRRIALTSFARNVKFTDVFDPSLPEVAGDRDQLIQVFLNLVRNASDAVPDSGGEITLTSAYRAGMRISSSANASPVSLPLEITVRDNGMGVPPELLPHIFDPFVTTKSRGSGLGLALAAKIVGDHGGVIECESVPGRTVFRVMLPKVEA